MLAKNNNNNQTYSTMQEAPNFSTYLNRFKAADRNTVLDGREKISGQDRSFLETVYSRLELYFLDDNFREQIPLHIRQSVEDNNISAIVSYLENIVAWQQDGTSAVVANLQSQIPSITSQVSAMDQLLNGYYYTNLSNTEPLGKHVQEITALKTTAEQEADNLHNVVENVQTQVNDRKSDFDKKLVEIEGQASDERQSQKDEGDTVLENIRKILDRAKLLIGSASGHDLANYYQKLANGRTTEDNNKFIDNRGKRFELLLEKFNLKIWAICVGIAFLIGYPLVMYLITHPINIDIWIRVLIIMILGSITIYVIVWGVISGLRRFNSRYKGGHARAAMLWMYGAIGATLGTAIYSAIIVHDLTVRGQITWEEIIPKIIVLLAPAYLVRLCIQNYRANAHLEVQYTHRATIVSIAENYSEQTTLTDPQDKANTELAKIALEAKVAILTGAAQIMFAQSESGYITQKEGAGSNSDNPMDSLSNIIIKK